MNLRTLLSWGMAAMLFAGCSGGTGSSTPSTNNAVPQTPASTGSLAALSFTFKTASGSASSGRRGAQYIGTGVTAISYTIAPIAGDYIAGSNHDNSAPIYTSTLTLGSAACPSSGVNQWTCTVNVEASTDYNVSLTDLAGATPVGYSYPSAATGPIASPIVASPAVVLYGNDGPGTNPTVSLQMVPILAGPQLGEGATTQFYIDGMAQTIALSTNEKDVSGNLINTGFGPVIDYPTITIAVDTSGTGAKTAQVGLIGPALTGYGTSISASSVNTAPGAGAYVGNLTLTDTAGVAGATPGSLFLFLNDIVQSSNEIEIPFVSFTSNASTLTAQGLGASNDLMATTTEATTQAAGNGLDGSFNASTNCGGSATITGPGAIMIGAGPTNVTTASAIPVTTVKALFTIQPVNINAGTCQLVVASATDPNLKDTFTIQLPAALSTTITSTNRH